MPETIPTQPTTTARQGHSAFSILVATFLTMIVVLLISNFSFLTSVALGSFAGFCVAAWNWLRMGRRRKALVHVLLGAGVYLSITVGYMLIAMVLNQVFWSAHQMKTAFNLPGVNSPGSILFMPHVNFQIATGLIAYCIASGALVLLYLYRATARDVPKTEPLEDGDELKRFLPLLAVAAISSATVVFANILISQIHIAQLQNHVYCELLQPGMTTEEVDAALSQIGPHQRAWFQDVPYPELSAQATSYDWVLWTNDDDDLFHKLNLWLGFSANNRLVWKGRYISGMGKVPFEEEFAAIECPWTFYQSITAR